MDSPSARSNHILAPVGSKSFLLSGQTDDFEKVAERNQVASSLSVFDHNTKDWKRHDNVKGCKPPGLRSGGFVAHGNFIYSFGGREDTGTGRYNCLHKFDTEEVKWIAFPETVNQSVEAPMPKAGCEPVIIDKKLCIFGGFGKPTGSLQPGSSFCSDGGVYDRGNTNEFHIYDLKNVAVPFWNSAKVSGDRPPPCSYYSLTLVDCKRAVMFGGNTPTGRINDVYIMTLDGINVNFQRLKKYGPWPKKRSSHAACVLNYDQEFPHLLVTGGLDENAQPLGDLWLLSVDHGTWNQVKEYEPFLCRWRPSLSSVSLGKKTASVLLFGGVGCNGKKISLTTILEFKLVVNNEEWMMEVNNEEWMMEEPTVQGNIPDQAPPDPSSQLPVQVTEDDGESIMICSSTT